MSHFIQTCFRQNHTSTPPVWFMRQSGRYLPEYQALRKNQSGNFINFCQNPDNAYAATMIPLKRYNLDASIVFSDILVIVDAMGLDINWDHGPYLAQPITQPKHIDTLADHQAHTRLNYVYQTIQRIKQDGPDLPCIGFSGSPWTIAAYMLDHNPSKRASERFVSARSFIYSHPKAAETLLAKLSEIITRYTCEQIEAGADAICLFDSWGHLLSHQQYEDYGYYYLNQITQHLQRAYPHIPVIIFGRHLSPYLEMIRDIPCQVVGLDWTVDLHRAQEILGPDKAIQGNLDNAILMSKPDKIAEHTQKLLKQQMDNPGFILNLGHGILPQTPPEHIETILRSVRTFHQA